VNTAKDRVVFFDSMADNVCAAFRASWGEGLNGTFETIECVAFAIHGNLECLVIIIAAGFAFRRHGLPKELQFMRVNRLSGDKRGGVSAVQKVAVPTRCVMKRERNHN
jgi:hypothetical protein